MFGARVILFVILSVALMMVDYQTKYLATSRAWFMAIAMPIQYITDLPVKIFDWINISFSRNQTLRSENTQLRSDMLLLRAQIQKLVALKRENNNLRALLQSASRTNEQVLVAQILAVTADPFDHQIVLDKGSKQGVYVGQPVLDADGVMGQVIQVSSFISRVLLVTDMRSAIPVENNRNGVRAVAIGRGSLDSLKLAYMSEATDIQKGDVFVTSGLGKNFPAGYPVGMVVRIENRPGEYFATIILKPSTHLDRGRQALLLWNNSGTQP